MIVASLALGMATFLAAAPPPPASQTAPLRISGVVMQTKLVQTSPLKYPEVARKKNIQGTVELDVIIGPDGKVKSVKVSDGPKELTKAAANAVKHWRYQPTVLKGKPVAVETVVDVSFKLTAPPPAKPAKGSPHN
jgi:TonB family protein